MDETVRYRLPLLAAGQAQKEVTHNEAVIAIDQQLHPAVLTRSMATPPATPTKGDSFIVAAAATGARTGQADAIATFDGFGWTFVRPQCGCLAWIADEAAFAVFDSGWLRDGWPVTALVIGGRRVLAEPPATIAAPTGGVIVDTEARAAIAAVLTLLRDQGLAR